MSRPDASSWSLERRLVAGTAAILATIVWTHGLAGLLRAGSTADAVLAAAPLTWGAVVAALVGSLLLPGRRGVVTAGLAGIAASAAMAVAWPGSGPGAVALPLAAGFAVWAAAHLGRRLPRTVDGALTRRRGVALAWAALALVGIAQTGRLATFMTDRSSDFVLTTRNPFWYGHECLNAYLYGAELAERGVEDLYEPSHYPALDPTADPVTRMEGMSVEDPYQYPPQFLLLPAAAIELTSDAGVIRVVWFAVQVTLLAAIWAGLALWIGGAPGGLALWLFPGAISAFPMLHTFQFGQFHLAAIALAVAAMLAFAKDRRAVGGLLLAVAVLAKIFPAVLLVALAARRRTRELAWTAGWGLALTLVALAVLGPQPFHAFLSNHLPRLQSGAAFAFDEAWPEVADLVVADNQGAFGLARKAGLDKAAAGTFGRVFGLAVLAVALVAGRRLGAASRWERAVTWLSLLGLASLTSPGAWGDYVPSTAIWVLALLACEGAERRSWRWFLALVAVLEYFLLGTMPIGSWAPPAVMVPISALGALGMVALFGLGLGRTGRWTTSARDREAGAETDPVERLAA